MRMAACVIMAHLALVMLVVFTILSILAPIFAMLLTFAVIVIHPLPVEVHFEEVELHIHTVFAMRFRRSSVRRFIRGHVMGRIGAGWHPVR